jgi:hypothetical protein
VSSATGGRWAASAVVLAVLLLGTGCSAGTAPERPVPSASPPGSTSSPVARPAVPQIPIQATTPGAQRASVPPVRIAVPDVGVDIAVEPVGVLDDGAMELPADTAMAGWYEYGPDPASAAGATILAAHVDSLVYGLGPFSRLRELAAGAPLSVTTADGAVHGYTIATVTKVPKAEIPLDTVFDRSGPPSLVLITCGGQFDHDTGHYLDNILVTATPVAG